jgi:K+-transporting ATPase ATPase A chain
MDHVLLIALIIGGTALLSLPLGIYMKLAMDPAPGQMDGPTRLFTRIGGAAEEQGWKAYLVTMLVFKAIMFTVTFLILALQQHLPLNPDGMGPHDPTLVFNTAASFTTNTNLQHYSGEASMSYLSQLAGLMWLQFVSAATGIAALAALARGIAGRASLGNFMIDVQRASFLVLLPLAVIVAMLMVLGGMPMTLQGSAVATTLEGVTQTIARGPVAAFLTIKQLGVPSRTFALTNAVCHCS